MCLSAVFEDQQIVLLGDLKDGWHVGRQAVQVHDLDGHGLVSDCSFNAGRIEGERVDVNISKHRVGSCDGNGVAGGSEGERRNDDFSAFRQL